MRSDVELLRIISAFGIIWFHSGYQLGRDIAYAGLVVFLIISSYFAVRSNRSISIEDRASRLLLPCIFWSAIYIVLLTIKGREIFPDNHFTLNLILATPTTHLWYLPFAFLCTVAIDLTKKKISPITLAVIATLAGSTLLLSSPLWRSTSYPPPFNQYLHAAPAIFIGVLYGLRDKINPKLRYLLLGSIFASIILILLIKTKGIGLNYLIGVSFTLLLLRDKSILFENKLILELSNLTFGIYLIHPIFLSVLGHIGLESVVLIFSVFAVSAASVYLAFKILPKSISKYII